MAVNTKYACVLFPLLIFLYAVNVGCADDHLITMQPEELFEIVYCVSKSGDKIAQRRMDICHTEMPYQTLLAFRRCQITKVSSNMWEFYNAMKSEPYKIVSLYECIARNTFKYNADEIVEVMKFEDCSRKVFATTCGKSELVRLPVEMGEAARYLSFEDEE